MSSRDSSVGRATDCRGKKYSVGRVFESLSRDNYKYLSF